MTNIRDGFSRDIVGRFPATPSTALASGISLLHEMVDTLTTGEVALRAKIHAGNIALVECRPSYRVFPDRDSSDRNPAVSEGVSLEEIVSWFRETAVSKDYGDVEIVCKVLNGRVVRVYRNDGDQYLVANEDEVADAA